MIHHELSVHTGNVSSDSPLTLPRKVPDGHDISPCLRGNQHTYNRHHVHITISQINIVFILIFSFLSFDNSFLTWLLSSRAFSQSCWKALAPLWIILRHSLRFAQSSGTFVLESIYSRFRRVSSPLLDTHEKISSGDQVFFDQHSLLQIAWFLEGGCLSCVRYVQHIWVCLFKLRFQLILHQCC